MNFLYFMLKLNWISQLEKLKLISLIFQVEWIKYSSNCKTFYLIFDNTKVLNIVSCRSQTANKIRGEIGFDGKLQTRNSSTLKFRKRWKFPTFEFESFSVFENSKTISKDSHKPYYYVNIHIYVLCRHENSNSIFQTVWSVAKTNKYLYLAMRFLSLLFDIH